jgi:hypothetical protein
MWEVPDGNLFAIVKDSTSISTVSFCGQILIDR